MEGRPPCLVKFAALACESRSSRSKLAISSKPYHLAPIAPGVGLGYRRNRAGPGAWVLRLADGKGGYETRNIGLADDLPRRRRR